MEILRNSAATKTSAILLALAETVRKQDTTELERRYLFKVAKWIIREFDPYFIVPNVSRAAASRAMQMGIDLRDIAWKQRDKITENGSKAFHYEHVIEIAALATEAMAATTPIDAADILRSIKVAWITQDENASLQANDKERRRSGGSRLRDRSCWEETCAAAGISFQHSW